MFRLWVWETFALFSLAQLVCAQAPQEDKRILGIIPNYKTMPSRDDKLPPLTPREKFHLATQDSFDPSVLLLAGFYSGLAQIQNQYADFGHGAAGFSKRFAAAYADQAIGNYLTEGIFPSVLHQDPRYFRMGHGGFLQRTGYAMTRIVVTRADSGRDTVNWSELGGNAIAAGISTAYYPAANRTPHDVLQKWGLQVGTDSAFNVLKEFWPDIKQKFTRHAAN